MVGFNVFPGAIFEWWKRHFPVQARTALSFFESQEVSSEVWQRGAETATIR